MNYSQSSSFCNHPRWSRHSGLFSVQITTQVSISECPMTKIMCPTTWGRPLRWAECFVFIKKPSILSGWHLRGIMGYSEIYTALTLTQPLSLDRPHPQSWTCTSRLRLHTGVQHGATTDIRARWGRQADVRARRFSRTRALESSRAFRGEEWQWIDMCD